MMIDKDKIAVVYEDRDNVEDDKLVKRERIRINEDDEKPILKDTYTRTFSCRLGDRHKSTIRKRPEGW